MHPAWKHPDGHLSHTGLFRFPYDRVTAEGGDVVQLEDDCDSDFDERYPGRGGVIVLDSTRPGYLMPCPVEADRIRRHQRAELLDRKRKLKAAQTELGDDNSVCIAEIDKKLAG